MCYMEKLDETVEWREAAVLGSIETSLKSP